MAIVDVSNRPWVVEIVPDNVVAEFTDESLTVEVPNGTPLVEFRCCEAGDVGGGGGGALQFQDEGLNLGAADSDTLNFVGALVEATRTGNTVTATVHRASNAETDAGVIDGKGVTPKSGAYAYDRFRYAGQHSAGKGTEVVELIPSSSEVTLDGNLSNVFEVTFTENLMFLNPVNPIGGQTVFIYLRQDAVGSRIVSFGEQWSFTNRITPVLTTTPNAVDALSCAWDTNAAKMRCTLLPNYGSGYLPPAIPEFADFNHVNVGGGNEIFRDVIGTDINFRTIVGGGDVTVNTVDDTVVVTYNSPTGLVEALSDLSDVDMTTRFPSVGDMLTFDGTAWVPASPRTWTLGATWTNGTFALATPLNNVNSVVAENARIKSWYLLTDGGSGSCQVDIRRVPISEFPPLIVDTICGSAKPFITGSMMNNDSDLIGWETTFAEGDLLQFVLLSTSGFTTVQLILILERLP